MNRPLTGSKIQKDCKRQRKVSLSPLEALSVNGPLTGVNSEEIRLMFHDQPRPGHIAALEPQIYSDT